MTHDPFPRDPLTPEEQALARRLGQLGPHGEPAPTLDARILAAARAAEATPARRVRRWPVALGVAASLVLAVGIAWRLRPLPGPAVEAEMARTTAAPAAPEAMDQAGAGRRAAAEDAAAPPAARPLEVAPSNVARAPAAPAEHAAPAIPAPAVAPEAVPEQPPTPEPTVVFDAPASAPMPAAAMVLPPPPPPAPPASDTRSRQMQAAPAGMPAPPARKTAAPTTQAEDDGGFDAAAAADAASGDEPSEDVPPATADAPAVREAWLQRIRELLADGQIEAARASLKEFMRRHPDAPLPDDLRALAR